MNTINYQPTGVYSQLVQNPRLLSNGGVNTSTQPAVLSEPKKDNKVLKFALKAGVAAVLIGAVYSGYKFKNYYTEGMKAIKDKGERLPGISSRSTLDTFLAKKCYSAAERDELIKLFNDAEKYNANIVGKLNRKLVAIRDFFKNNFYNY